MELRGASTREPDVQDTLAEKHSEEATVQRFEQKEHVNQRGVGARLPPRL